MSSETPQAEQCDGGKHSILAAPSLEEQISNLHRKIQRLYRRIEILESHSHAADGRCVVSVSLANRSDI